MGGRGRTGGGGLPADGVGVGRLWDGGRGREVGGGEGGGGRWMGGDCRVVLEWDGIQRFGVCVGGVVCVGVWGCGGVGLDRGKVWVVGWGALVLRWGGRGVRLGLVWRTGVETSSKSSSKPSNLSALQGDDLNPSIFIFVHQPIRVYGIAMVDLAVYEVGLRGKVTF
ncbi:hypothetical protein Tco_0796796 [Tanacetum coccineum]